MASISVCIYYLVCRVELYVVMVQRGLRTIDQVPARYREQVRALLEQVEQ